VRKIAWTDCKTDLGRVNQSKNSGIAVWSDRILLASWAMTSLSSVM